jgi:hypothetical protein
MPRANNLMERGRQVNMIGMVNTPRCSQNETSEAKTTMQNYHARAVAEIQGGEGLTARTMQSLASGRKNATIRGQRAMGGQGNSSLGSIPTVVGKAVLGSANEGQKQDLSSGPSTSPFERELDIVTEAKGGSKVRQSGGEFGLDLGQVSRMGGGIKALTARTTASSALSFRLNQSSSLSSRDLGAVSAGGLSVRSSKIRVAVRPASARLGNNRRRK